MIGTRCCSTGVEGVASRRDLASCHCGRRLVGDRTPHRSLTPLDWLLIASSLPAIVFIAGAYFSIPIEETHDIGNDASFDRLTIALGLVWLAVTGASVALRRVPGGLRAQIGRERQQWRDSALTSAAIRTRRPPGEPHQEGIDPA